MPCQCWPFERSTVNHTYTQSDTAQHNDRVYGTQRHYRIHETIVKSMGSRGEKEKGNKGKKSKKINFQYFQD